MNKHQKNDIHLGDVKGAFRSPQRGAKLTTLKKAVITGQDDNNPIQNIKTMI